MQYIDNIQPKDEQQGTWQPNHTPTTEWQNPPDMMPTITTLNGFEVRLSIAAKETHCKQNNGHLDVRVYVQIQVTRHCIQSRTICRSQTRLRIAVFLSTRSTLITTDQNHDTISRNDRDDNSSSKPEKRICSQPLKKNTTIHPPLQKRTLEN